MTQTPQPASPSAPDCSIRPRTCNRTMPVASPQAHCTSCHETFSSVKNLDAHQPGKVRANGTVACGKPGELTRTKRDGSIVPLFSLIDTSRGPMWISYSDESTDPDS